MVENKVLNSRGVGPKLLHAVLETKFEDVDITGETSKQIGEIVVEVELTRLVTDVEDEHKVIK